jgi:hypothetical protein
MNMTNDFPIDLLFELGKEKTVRLIVRVVLPFNFFRAGNAANPIPLGTGAHIDELCPRSQLPNFVSFLRRQCAGIGEAQFVCSRLSKIQKFSQLSHDGGQMSGWGRKV